MTPLDVGKKLVELCKQGKNEEAVEALYSPDIVSVEAGAPPGDSPERRGLAATDLSDTELAAVLSEVLSEVLPEVLSAVAVHEAQP